MARRGSTSTSPHEGDSGGELGELRGALNQLRRFVRAAKRNKQRIRPHTFYGAKVSEGSASARRNLLLLIAKYESVQGVASILQGLLRTLGKLQEEPDSAEVLKALEGMIFSVESDLVAALQSSTEVANISRPLLPPEIVPNGVYRRILEEANSCYAHRCFDACAAMLRRLIESLIIEAFEAKGLESKIKSDGEYLELKALIGRATAEAELRLGRNTRDALPKLKFFGDLSLHSRRNLIREHDLTRLHGDARCAIEELASHMAS